MELVLDQLSFKCGQAEIAYRLCILCPGMEMDFRGPGPHRGRDRLTQSLGSALYFWAVGGTRVCCGTKK